VRSAPTLPCLSAMVGTLSSRVVPSRFGIGILASDVSISVPLSEDACKFKPFLKVRLDWPSTERLFPSIELSDLTDG